jgi:hypothetical protein
MTQHEDDLAALRALVDQAVEQASELARAVAAYYSALVRESVPPDAATQIVIAWQTALFLSKPSEAQEEEEDQ